MSVVYPKDALRSYRRIHKANCFVLMPFDPRFDEVYEKLHATLQSPDLNLICRRADDVRAPNILETILKQIAQSEYVLADLTGSNPNVFYELGIAHCVKDASSVVILAQDIGSVPFDLRHLRCILYEQNAEGLDALAKELIATFRAASKDAFRFLVREGRKFTFGKKLAGQDRNLFDLTVECPHVGLDAVKILLHFERFSIDADLGPVESQFLFLSDDRRSARVQNIPWELHLVESRQGEALLALEKAL